MNSFNYFILEKTIRVYTTLLHIACKKGFGDCVRLLLSDEHVDINFKDGDDMTPLELMCSKHFTFNMDPILTLLLKDSRIVIDCHPNIYRFNDYRPFYSYVHKILNNINLDIVELFLSKDADITNGLTYSEAE